MQLKFTAPALLAAMALGAAPAMAATRAEQREGQNIDSALVSAHASQRAADAAAKLARRDAKGLRGQKRVLNAVVKELTVLAVDATSFGKTTQALTVGLANLNSEVNSPTTGLSAVGSAVSALGAKVNDPASGIAALNAGLNSVVAKVSDKSTGLDAVNASLGALTSKVNDPNTGLGQVDNGVAELYVTVGNTTQPVAPLFAPNVSLARGNGATAAGTVPVPCPATCTFSIYAGLNSNKPNTGVPAQVGGTLVISAVDSSTGAESLAFAGGTPNNAKYANSPLVDLPARRPLTSNYPGPGDSSSVLVPFSGANSNADGTVTLPAGTYIVSGTLNFLKAS